MYAGSTFTKFSGRLLGAHQKIDRLARKQLDNLEPKSAFPCARAILLFEGKNGPDGIKRKSPAVDEPWHYLQPFDLKDTKLTDLIDDHYRQLVKSLKTGDEVRASFEAAWLAHAIVDGLTPAHHYPYEEKLIELRGGRSIAERTSIAKKLIMPGFASNWKMWGPKGLFTTHASFEMGIAMLLAFRRRRVAITPEKIAEFASLPLSKWFRQRAQDVAGLELYETFYETGWTLGLARRARRHLVPVLAEAVALTWYGALQEAQA